MTRSTPPAFTPCLVQRDFNHRGANYHSVAFFNRVSVTMRSS